ncbi:MAG: hypothetical protein Q7T25_09445 [Sideroxyarcus sp.]|nr:hypothetical protein [Sideroxyarcus sp.]
MKLDLKIQLDSKVPDNGRLVTMMDDEMFILAIGAESSTEQHEFLLLDTSDNIEQARQLHNDAILWVHQIDNFPWIEKEGEEFAVALVKDYGRYRDGEEARYEEAASVAAEMADLPNFGMF